jgi:hypothetical protein
MIDEEREEVKEVKEVEEVKDFALRRRRVRDGQGVAC